MHQIYPAESVKCDDPDDYSFEMISSQACDAAHPDFRAYKCVKKYVPEGK
jgi:hypothetical protein